ncbi:MAG: hypothetical protein IT210_04390 [Armatimonadetes bacterium]|nr:hypothetical protein [Armatimonadota bacterium]
MSFLISVLITRYDVFTGNQAIQIPLIHELMDRRAFPSDPFAAILPYYASMLWRVVAMLHIFFHLQPLLLGLFIARQLFVLYAAGRLAHAFMPGSRLAAMGAMLMLAFGPVPLVGSGTIFNNYFEQSGLCTGFLLMAAAAFIERKPLRWAVWMGIAFNVNILYGIYASVYFTAVTLAVARYRSQWKEWAKHAGVALLIALPTLWLALQSFSREASDSHLWMAASRARSAHHLMPLAWGNRNWFLFAFFFLLFSAAFYLYRKKHPEFGPFGLAWTGVCLFWVGLSFVAAYMLPSPKLLQLQPIRGTDIWYAPAGILLISLVADYAYRIVTHRPLRQQIWASALFVVSIAVWRVPVSIKHALSAFSIGLLMFVIYRLLIERGRSSRGAFSVFRTPSYSLALSCILPALILGIWLEKPRLSDDSFEAFAHPPEEKIEYRTARWAATHASYDSVFLTDPGWDQFRSIAERPIFVSWKDGTGLFWDRSFASEWIERLVALGIDYRQAKTTSGPLNRWLTESYRRLGDEDIWRLLRAYRIDYWVVDKKHSSCFPVVYQGARWKILRVSG